MSSHDTHQPAQESKGIWALPMAAFIVVLVLVVIFTCPKSDTKHEAPAHEKTEAHH